MDDLTKAVGFGPKRAKRPQGDLTGGANCDGKGRVPAQFKSSRPDLLPRHERYAQISLKRPRRAASSPSQARRAGVGYSPAFSDTSRAKPAQSTSWRPLAT